MNGQHPLKEWEQGTLKMQNLIIDAWELSSFFKRGYLIESLH
jgi:hypothetical protein